MTDLQEEREGSREQRAHAHQQQARHEHAAVDADRGQCDAGGQEGQREQRHGAQLEGNIARAGAEDQHPIGLADPWLVLGVVEGGGLRLDSLGDLVAAMAPRYVRLTARFNVRGGIYTTVVAEHHAEGWDPRSERLH